jgi:predicted CopG family antitoxin
MPAAKKIAVTEAVWIELTELKARGQTSSQPLEEMIEDRKKGSTIQRHGKD